MIKTLPVMASSWTDVGKDSSNLNVGDCSGVLAERETSPMTKAIVRK